MATTVSHKKTEQENRPLPTTFGLLQYNNDTSLLKRIPLNVALSQGRVYASGDTVSIAAER